MEFFPTLPMSQVLLFSPIQTQSLIDIAIAIGELDSVTKPKNREWIS